VANPIVWLLLGRKAGDNSQVLALADALGIPFEQKSVEARSWELLTHLLPWPSLAGIDRGLSSPLQAPWPDLLLTAGRRNEPVAHWIKRQSGGRCALVQLGRPWSSLSRWDLIVSTPQYFLPPLDNVLVNRLPLHSRRCPEAGLVSALSVRLGEMPRPYIAVLVGGDSGRFVFTPGKGRRLGRQLNQLAQTSGGSLLLTDSARTPDESFDALLGEISVPQYCFRWGASVESNPYQAFLELADQLVVTGESMSMLGEAAATGKPLHIFDMGDDGRPWWRHLHNYRVKPLSHHAAMRFGPRRMRRDVGNIQQALVGSGQAVWLGERHAARQDAIQLDRRELELTAARVRALLPTSA
jgi:mitochondrial fission protein ELM1